MRVNKVTFWLVLGAVLLITWTAFFGLLGIPGANQMRFGIDIRGGVDAVFQPVDLNRLPTIEELESARSIIETRLDQKNILDREVTIDATNGDVIVRFPWKSDETDFNPQKAIAELGETAKLTFRDESGNILVDGKDVTKSVVEKNSQTSQYEVSLTFNDEGTTKFAEATKNNIGKKIGIYMDETLIKAPVVEDAIYSGRAAISNIGTYEDANSLAQKIAAGALPFSLEARNYSTISPSLGSGALNVMVTAGFWAFAIICILLLIYYRLSGVVACIALMLQVSGQLLALSIPQITLTLPGIAGVILSIGMGVDANVIISERISEEIKSGKSTQQAILIGFKNAFSSVFDGNITVMIVAIILMIFGSGSMLSFAYSLLTGVILNFLAGVTASHLMMRSLCKYPKLSREPLYESLSRRIVL
ncbi:MAG TPA: protein translocase subunit SecD [Candidatus Limiplasma sp.]|nr:protein translocase subunit SecD [Candidatus Limiplasma sp.]